MPLHIIKLCVGAESVEDLEAWIADRLAAQAAAGRTPEQTHVTRMYPKRAAEIVGEGSLYWVVRGSVQVRQPILDIRPEVGEDGVERCALVLDPALVRTEPRPHRPFQGWRYLADKDAPRDLRQIVGAEDMDPDMRRALAELALI